MEDQGCCGVSLCLRILSIFLLIVYPVAAVTAAVAATAPTAVAAFITPAIAIVVVVVLFLLRSVWFTSASHQTTTCVDESFVGSLLLRGNNTWQNETGTDQATCGTTP